MWVMRKLSGSLASMRKIEDDYLSEVSTVYVNSEIGETDPLS